MNLKIWRIYKQGIEFDLIYYNLRSIHLFKVNNAGWEMSHLYAINFRLHIYSLFAWESFYGNIFYNEIIPTSNIWCC